MILMCENGFGYVEVENKKIKVVSGSSRNPIINYYENQQILDDYEKIEHLREYLKVMKDEPDEYILLSKVYHDLRRILGDE